MTEERDELTRRVQLSIGVYKLLCKEFKEAVDRNEEYFRVHKIWPETMRDEYAVFAIRMRSGQKQWLGLSDEIRALKAKEAAQIKSGEIKCPDILPPESEDW